MDSFDTHCFIGFDGKFYAGEVGHNTEGTHPATKKQWNILFQKMKEAGYEWNSEKKELEPPYKFEVVPHSRKGLEMTVD